VASPASVDPSTWHPKTSKSLHRACLRLMKQDVELGRVSSEKAWVERNLCAACPCHQAHATLADHAGPQFDRYEWGSSSGLTYCAFEKSDGSFQWNDRCRRLETIRIANANRL
jgi:hypothetical protein